jgi:branched-subunit amino acid aminotransferase/4-amino-4-deoxychorismate lyase
MDRLIYHNNRIVDASEAKVEATLAGLLYGWGVFTTMRIYDGRVFAFNRNWERLTRHGEKARVSLPLTYKEAQQAIDDLIQANAVANGRARITVLKGEAGGWAIDKRNASEVLIFTASETVTKPREVNLTLSPYRLLSSNPLVGVKRTSMLEHLLALDEARARSFDDAVLLNERGEMVSATSGNLFWVEGSELFTPSLTTGCVAGITRAFILEIAKRVNIHATEGSFPITRLLDASEVFLSSTARGITPIRSYDVKVYDSREALMSRNLVYQFKKLIADAKMDR